MEFNKTDSGGDIGEEEKKAHNPALKQYNI